MTSSVQSIDLTRLRPHPDNPNHMPARQLEKLVAHIRRSGRYEPLVVRPYPGSPERYQILNGHHRAEALRALGYTAVACVVWDVDDDDALLYLATLNRLVGADVPERRAALLDELLHHVDLAALTELLPETERELAAIIAAAESPLLLDEDMEDMPVPPVEFVFRVDPAGADGIRRALDLYQQRHPNTSSADALVGIAGQYVETAEGSFR